MKYRQRSSLTPSDWLPILFGGAIFGGVLWQSIYLGLQSIGNDRPVEQVARALLIAFTAWLVATALYLVPAKRAKTIAAMVAVGAGAGLPVLGYFIVFAMLGGR